MSINLRSVVTLHSCILDYITYSLNVDLHAFIPLCDLLGSHHPRAGRVPASARTATAKSSSSLDTKDQVQQPTMTHILPPKAS